MTGFSAVLGFEVQGAEAANAVCGLGPGHQRGHHLEQSRERRRAPRQDRRPGARAARLPAAERRAAGTVEDLWDDLAGALARAGS